MAGIIPKEELATYQRWQAGSFDAKPAPVAASSSPVNIPEEQGEAEGLGKLRLPTAEEIERIHEEAHAEGYKNGHAEGLLAGKQEAEKASAIEIERFSGLLQNLKASLSEMDQQTAEQLLELALEVSRQVIRSTIETQKEILLPVIREAIAALPLHHTHLVLHLNPADAIVIREKIGEQLAQAGTQIVEDSTLSAGGCTLVAGASEIDATIETRWKRVLEAIGVPPTEWLSNK